MSSSPHSDQYGCLDDRDRGDYDVHSTGADMMPADKKFKLKPQKDKTCLVCGDKALGYNFNAISCESCKAFFRRNAFKDIRGRCEGKCEVTVESRSYCKRCRLQKCFSVGMKRDLILNEAQKLHRRQKIQENRMRRSGAPGPSGNILEYHGLPGLSTPLLTPIPMTPSTTVTSSPSPVSASCGSASGSDTSSPPTFPNHTGRTTPPLPIKEEPNDEMKVAPHAIAAAVRPADLEGLPESLVVKIKEVIKAFQVSFDAPMERDPTSTPSGEEFLNMADSSVRRLVKMAKQLAVFRQLEQADQICLLKGSVVEVLILRSAKMFDVSAQSWKVKKGGSASQVSAAALQYGDSASASFFKQYQRFAVSLLQSTKQDSTILMLLIVLTVFSPDRAQPSSRERVMRAQEHYADVLREYIGYKYPQGDLMLPKILQKLTDIRELNETHTQMLIHMRVDQLEPLIVEIFDLSS